MFKELKIINYIQRKSVISWVPINHEITFYTTLYNGDLSRYA